MIKILLDTSIIIDFLRRKDKENTLLYSIVKRGYQPFVSIITHTELYAGKSVWENKRAQEELEALFSGIQLMPLESEISQKAGELKVKYNMNLLDAIIAATALVNKLEVFTLDTKDFEKIKEIKRIDPKEFLK